MDGICSECNKPCKEVYKKVDFVTYNHRDREVVDNIYDYVSDCCGEKVRRFNEDEEEG